MPFDYSPWPHLDVAGLPKFVQKFLAATIVISLYVGSLFMLVLVGMIVTEVMNLLLGTGSAEFSRLASVLSSFP